MRAIDGDIKEQEAALEGLKKIMVKIKGICRALGRVIERALRSEVSGDADETHQRQRSIASVHRQRAATLVAEDVEHVDHAADEVHDQPQEAVVDVQGFPGRPHNTLVLMDYIHHVERPGLKLSSYERKVQKFGRFAPEIEGIVVVTGLSPLIAYSLDTGHKGIISAFAESYAWGVVALIDMYENLNDGSKRSASQIVGYITLLQCSIYEHFPTVVSSIVVEGYHERKPCACYWKSGKILPVSAYHKRLDTLASHVVCWIPYNDHRAFREFKLISLFSGDGVHLLSYTD
ncbi:Protein MAIN-LIKE 2 [Glycine max]|nr:Protein MAIN-LIKE 2 [Glycine max]